MLHWLPFPFIRFTLVWMGGLLLGMSIQIPALWILAGVLWIFYFLLTLKLRGVVYYKYHTLLGFIALTLVLLCGMLRVTWSDPYLHPQTFQAQAYWAEVMEPPVLVNKYLRFTVKVSVVHTESGHHVSHKRIYWFQDLNRNKEIHYGDLVLVKGAPVPVPQAANPHQFNYKLYLQRHGIHGQHWLQDSHILSIQRIGAPDLSGNLHRLRDYLQNHLSSYITGPQAAQILGAMLLGNRRQVADEVEDVFAKSGTLHILAVSGLHLGIIYGFLVVIFGNLRYRPRWRWIFFILSLVALWGFALLTGLAASTRRSAIMFSVMLAANQWGYRGNNYNALCFSAFLILLLDPYELYDVGFQLSYTALTGILWLQPKISAWWHPKRRLGKYIWDILSVSLAAQVAVLPLGVYYFHQIPLYFLLGNLFMMPLTFLVLLVGLLFFIFSFSSVGSTWLGKLLTLLTELVHFINQQIASLPGSTLTELWISLGQLAAVYGLLILAVGYASTRRKLFLQALLGLWLLWLGSILTRPNEEVLAEVVVYQVKGYSAIDFVRDGFYAEYLSEGIPPKEVAYNLTPNRRAHHWQQAPSALVSKVDKTYKIWMFQGKLVILVTGPMPPYQGLPVNAFIVIVSNNAVKNLEDLTKRFNSEHIIVDGSNHPLRSKELVRQAKPAQVTLFSTQSQGAFRIRINSKDDRPWIRG